MVADPMVRLFYCYAREDQAQRDKLDDHLKSLKLRELITTWHDRQIVPGKDWKKEIDAHLQTSHLILLLVSVDFIRSDYCRGIEMQQALELHNAGKARVIPVILRHVNWKGMPFDNLQVLPKGATPVKSWEDQDEAFFNIAKGIESILKEMQIRLNTKEYRLEEGNDYVDKGRYEEALECFNAAISLDENYSEAIAHRGWNHHKLGRDEEALKDINRAIALDNKNVQALAWRGAIYYQMGRYQEALADLKEDFPVEQMYYIWSDVGLRNRHTSFRACTTSPNLTEIYGEPPKDVDRYMRYILPPGADRFAITPEMAPVCLAFMCTAWNEYILIHYNREDGVNRSGNLFVHAIVLGEYSPYFSVKDAIRLWDADIWRSNDQGLDQGSNSLKPIPVKILKDNPHFRPQFVQVSNALPFLIEAYLTRRERSPLYLAAPADQTALIASLIAGLVNCLPRQLLKGLTFSTYEPDVTKATAEIVGTCWIATTPGQETGSAPVFSPQFYGEKLAINCFTEECSPLRDHPQATYNPVAADFAEYVTECLVTGNNRGQLDDLCALAEENQALNIPLFLQLYNDKVVNAGSVDMAEIERSLKEIARCRDLLSSRTSRKQIINCAIANPQWSKGCLQPILRSLKDQAVREEYTAPFPGYASGYSALSAKQEQMISAAQGMHKSSQIALTEALSQLAQSTLLEVVKVIQAPVTSVGLPRRGDEGQNKVQVVISLLDLLHSCLLPQAAPAVWKKLLDRIQQDQNAIDFLVAHWDIHVWLLGIWSKTFPVTAEYDSAVYPLVIVPWEHIGEFLQVSLNTRHRQWNIFAAEKLATDSSLTPPIAQQLGQNYASEITGLLTLLLQEKDSTLAANFLIRLVEKGYQVKLLRDTHIEALLLRTDSTTGYALLDLLGQYGYPQKKKLVKLLLRCKGREANLKQIVMRVYPTAEEQHEFFLHDGPGYLRRREYTQALITLYRNLLPSYARGKMERLFVLLDTSLPEKTILDLLRKTQIKEDEYARILEPYGKFYLENYVQCPKLAERIVEMFASLVHAEYSHARRLFFTIVTSQTGYQYIEGLLQAAALQPADQRRFLENYGASYFPYCSQMPTFKQYIVTYIENFEINYLAQLVARAEARNFFTALTQYYQQLSLDEHTRQDIQSWQIIDGYRSTPTTQLDGLYQLVGALYWLGLPNNAQFRAQIAEQFVSCIQTSNDLNRVMNYMHQLPQIRDSIWQFLYLMAGQAAARSRQLGNRADVLLPYLVCALTVEEQIGHEKVASVYTEHFRQEFLDTLLVHVDVGNLKAIDDLLRQQESSLPPSVWEHWNKYLERLELSERIGGNTADAVKTFSPSWLVYIRDWLGKIKQQRRGDAPSSPIRFDIVEDS
jgi:tetratricopeptide (TPR) repeat protein